MLVIASEAMYLVANSGDSKFLELFYKVKVEDAFEYAKLLLDSEFREKIKIHYNDNVYFKLMEKELKIKETIELLTLIFQKYPETKMHKIENIFKR